MKAARKQGKMESIGFIGAGNMAEALMRGLIAAKVAHSTAITAYDVKQERLTSVVKSMGINAAAGAAEVFAKADTIILAVKPQQAKEALRGISADSSKMVISILAGVRLAALEKLLPEARIVRVMPNLACIVRKMAAGFSLGKRCTGDDADSDKRILASSGIALEVREEQLDAVTGLSGSGPAFVAYIAKAMIAAGIEQGLTIKAAEELTLQTLIGTAELLRKKEMKPEELIKMVSSPNGTTVAGLSIMEDSDVEDIIKETIAAATRRSVELGKKE